jgi:spermidine synthase
MSRIERVAVAVVVLMGGAILMALEVAAFRIIGRTYGTALRETTTVIAVFLTAMSIGYYLGGRFGDRYPKLSTLGWVLVLATPLMLAVLQFDERLTETIAASNAPRALHAFAATTILFAVPTVLLAAISPIAVRLLSTDATHSGRVAGKVSALSTIGSIAGTVLAAFVLIDFLGSIRLTVLVLAAATLLLAAVLAASSIRKPRASWARAPIAIGALSALAIGFAAADRGGQAQAMSTTGARVLYERDTPYHHIRVVDRPPGVRDLFIGSTLQSNYRPNDPHLRGLPYEEYKHFAKVVRPGIKNILMIGLGGGTSARQFISYYPDVTIDAVEIDPVIVDVAQRFFDVKPGDRLRLHAGDGRAFLRRSSREFDMISVDAYTHGRYGSTIPPHLVTREFFEEVSAKLSDGGIFHFHSYAPRDSRFSRAVYKTIRQVFPAVVILGHTELIASTAPLHIDAEELRARSAGLREKLPDIDARFATLTTDRLETEDVPVMTDDFAPVDSLLSEVLTR